MVLESEFPPDDRVEKEAVSLIQAGHEVHLACYSRKGNFIFSEKYNGISIHRKFISNFLYKTGAANLVLPFYYLFWKKFLTSLNNSENFDAIHIHDLPLAKLGYFFKKEDGMLMVCDQHEYYSNWIVDTAHYNTFIGKVVKFLSPWKKYEKKYLQKADLVTTVEEPLRKIYIEEVGVSEDRVLIVPNTPLKSVFNHENIKKKIIDLYKDHFIILYIGGMDILRGIDTAIKAMPELVGKIPSVKLLLIGSKSKYFDLEKIARENNVSEHVEFIDFQPVSLLPSYINASDICFFTPKTTRDEIHKTIATKIYQYVAMGKPVIVSKARMMKEFVEKNQIGFAINENNPEEFSRVILKIYEDEALSEQLCANAIKTSELFTWESTTKPLIDFYNRNDIA